MTDLQKYRSKLLGMGFKNSTPPLMQMEYFVCHDSDDRIEVYLRGKDDENIEDYFRFWFSKDGEILDV